MMMLLYRIIFIPGLILGLPYYAYRMWRRGGYRKGFENRFGVMRNVPPKRENVKRIWIQAVSVGELMAIGPLLRQLAQDGSIEVILSTTTSTGLKVLSDKLASLTIWYGIFPLDFWLCSRKAWTVLQPDLVVLMEGELWPEHIRQAALRKVPVLLANARLSDRSYARHRSIKEFAKAYLGSISCILAGSESDQERFRELGWIPAERILLTGNLKLDVAQEAPPSDEDRRRMLAEFGFMGDPVTVFLGSSTWPGEEEALISIYLVLKDSFPNLRLLIVPRHAERKNELVEIVKAFPVRHHFRSDAKQAPPGTEVYIADTTGELHMLTRFSDLLFVGKSLPPNTGGQTPIEAAALGKAMIFGPDMSNFRDISRKLLESGAARRVENAGELSQTVRELLDAPADCAVMGARANQLIQASRGATGRIVRQIKTHLAG